MSVNTRHPGFHNRASVIRKGKPSLQSINSCMLVLDEDYPQAMPFKDTLTNPAEFDNPSDYHLALGPVLKEHKGLFNLQLGRTTFQNTLLTREMPHQLRFHPVPYPFSAKTMCTTSSRRWQQSESSGRTTAHGAPQPNMCQRTTGR